MTTKGPSFWSLWKLMMRTRTYWIVLFLLNSFNLSQTVHAHKTGLSIIFGILALFCAIYIRNPHASVSQPPDA
jgi:hypothetical protein